MKEPNSQNSPDELFREAFKNLPEEQATLQEWATMRKRLQSEGMLSSGQGRKKLLFLFPLVAVLTVLAIAFLFSDKDVAPAGLSAEKNVMTQRDEKKTENISGGKHVIAEKYTPDNVQPSVDRKRESDKTSEEKIHSNNSNENGFVSEPKATNKKSKTINNIMEVAPEKNQYQYLAPVPPAMNKISNEIPDDNNPEKPSVRNNSSSSVNNTSYAAKEHPENNVQTSSSTLAETQILTDHSTHENTINKDSTQSFPLKKDSTLEQTQPAVTVNKDTTISENNNLADAEVLKKKHKHFYTGGYFSWDINNYKLEDTKHTPDGEYVQNQLNKNNDSLKHAVQFTAGAMGGYELSEYLSVETTIFYSQKKRVKRTLTIHSDSSEFGENITSYSYYYNAQYLELGCRLKYYLNKGKVNYYAAAGMLGSFNFPVKEEKRGYFIRTFYSETTLPKEEKIIFEPHSLGMSILLSAGAQIKMNEKWSIYAEPSYRYGLNPVIKHSTYDKVPVTHFWRTIAFGIGAIYTF